MQRPDSKRFGKKTEQGEKQETYWIDLRIQIRENQIVGFIHHHYVKYRYLVCQDPDQEKDEEKIPMEDPIKCTLCFFLLVFLGKLATNLSNVSIDRNLVQF